MYFGCFLKSLFKIKALHVWLINYDNIHFLNVFLHTYPYMVQVSANIINLLLKSSVCFPSSILDVFMFSTSVLLLLSVLVFVTEPHGGRRGVPGVLV